MFLYLYHLSFLKFAYVNSILFFSRNSLSYNFDFGHPLYDRESSNVSMLLSLLPNLSPHLEVTRCLFVVSLS